MILNWPPAACQALGRFVEHQCKCYLKECSTYSEMLLQCLQMLVPCSLLHDVLITVNQNDHRDSLSLSSPSCCWPKESWLRAPYLCICCASLLGACVLNCASCT